MHRMVTQCRELNVCEWKSVTYHEVIYAFPCFVLLMNTYLLDTALVSADNRCCMVVQFYSHIYGPNSH